MPIAPAFAASYGLVDELGMPGTTTEAFSWLTTAIVAGLAVGSAVGGAAIDPLGITGALALAAPCAGIAALVGVPPPCLADGRRGGTVTPDAEP